MASVEGMTNVGIELVRKQFLGTTLRVHGTFENPLYCAQDIGKALELKHIRESLKHLENNEKTQVSVSLTAGRRAQNMTFVTEPGLYKLILWCRKAKQKGTNANRFMNWVTHEVLPSIRKSGQYKLEQTISLLKEDARRTVNFLRKNRYHVFGRNVLHKKIHSEDIFNFLNRQSRYIKHHLTWEEHIPYVRPGSEDPVRMHLLRAAPVQTNILDGYGFFD